MSAAGSRGTSSGLDSLLASVDPRFNRPSMQDMKAKGGASKLGASALQQPPNSSPPKPPVPSSVPPVATVAAGSDPFALEHLEHMMKSRSSPSLAQQRRASQTSASGNSLNSLGNRLPNTTAADTFDDLLGDVPGASTLSDDKSMRQVEAATSPVPKPAASVAATPPPPPPLAEAPAPASARPAVEEDPFSLFGGPPPSAAGSGRVQADSCISRTALPMADIDDSFLAAFAAPLSLQPQQPQQSSASISVKNLSGNFGKLHGSEDQEAPAAAAAASLAKHSSTAAATTGTGCAAERQVPGTAPGGATSSFGYERPHSVAASPGQARYRVFDYVQSEEGASAGAATTSRPLAGQQQAGSSGNSPLEEGLHMPGGGASQQQRRPARPAVGALHSDSYQQLPQNTKEVVSDLSLKAAKALQSGTKWFMKASKTLVAQVQQRLETHTSSSSAAGSADRPTHGPGEPKPFHYDWAAQLARISPDSRSAALGAMTEDDRLAVQRILDETALCDSYMQGREYDGCASGASQERQDQHQSQGPKIAGAAAAGADRSSGSFEAAAEHSLGSSWPSLASAMTGTKKHRPRTAAAAPPPTQQPPQYNQLFGQDATQAAAKAAWQQQQQQPPPSRTEDLLGMTASLTGPGSSRPPPVATVQAEDDLLGFSSAAPGPAANSVRASAVSSTAHIDDLFTVPTKKAPPASSSSRAGGGIGIVGVAAGSSAPRGKASTGLDSMIDLGTDLPSVGTAGFETLYQDAEEDGGTTSAGEPEMRGALRQRRIQEKHERMIRQLAEKRARDEVEAAEKSGKVELRSLLQPKIDAWAAGKKDNIRALLASLHTVLWKDSGWIAPSIADMVDNNKVKRIYMKANLVVHPDKVKQKGGSLEQVATADMVFHVLNMAWGKFEA